MLRVLTGGLPVSARDLLSRAMEEAMGSGVVEFVEVDRCNLRSSVRLSTRDSSVALVVLDGESADYCKDIENGLYSSDKFYRYSGDVDLVKFLNNRYSLSMEVPEDLEIQEYTEKIDLDVVEHLQAQLKSRNQVISSYQAQIRDLTARLEDESIDSVPSEELESLQSELDEVSEKNRTLRETISSMESELLGYKDTISKLKSEKDEAITTGNDSARAYKSLKTEYDSLSQELSDLRVQSSKQVSLINSRNEELKKVRESLDDAIAERGLVSDQLDDYKGRLSDKMREVSDLGIELDMKNKEVSRLNEELKSFGDTDKILAQTKKELQLVNDENSRLSRKISDMGLSMSSSTEEMETYKSRVVDLESENGTLKSKLSSCEGDLVSSNNEIIELRGKVSLLEKASGGVNVSKDITEELSSLRRKYAELSANIFSQIYQSAGPTSGVRMSVLHTSDRFSHIQFVFSGSSESRKGTYKWIREECQSGKYGRDVVIVDAVSETSIDYVFGIKRVVRGSEWFSKGGGIQPYLSETRVDGIKVLSPGLEFVNDAFFLTVDWLSRIRELENSGYFVVMYCGDISNLVGRILHQSFAGVGTSYIVVQGNAVGSRSVITNIKGINNSTESTILYYDFSANAAQRLYEIVNKTHKCVILNSIDTSRRQQ